MQKRDSKSFDAVALHKNQLDEEDPPVDEKPAHQSVNYGVYGNGGRASAAVDVASGDGAVGGSAATAVEDRENENGVNGDAKKTNGEQTPSSTNEVSAPNNNSIRSLINKMHSIHPFLYSSSVLLHTRAHTHPHESHRWNFVMKLQHKTTLNDAEIQSAVEAAAVIFKKVVLQRRKAKKDEGECHIPPIYIPCILT